MIVQGTGIARVTKIGVNTELGKIGKALQEVKEEPTRLNTEMNSLVKKITFAAFGLCILVIICYTITRGDVVKGFLSGITLAMSILPEEFPVVLTIFMALGAWRMAKKQVLTRKPSAIETLGSATVLCSDKTGTLTQNKMAVAKLYNGHDFFTVSERLEIREEFHEIIEYGILSSQTNPYDPMEKAILGLGEKWLKHTEHIHPNWKMVKEYPLSRELLAMSRVFAIEKAQGEVIAAKGSPEAIFDLCHIAPEKRLALDSAVEELAKEGLRVLGVARGKINETELPEIQHDFQFELVGLIGLSDPLRKNVPEAIKECHKAGIRVIMITGDYPVTAKNIAREIGIKNYDQCITGMELQALTEEELAEKIKDTDVFARVIPEQKLKIVKALQRNNEIVAMTGDGINDAPALKSANIGIAMGEKGTDVAREASSLVLMDDNFSSIVSAIRMGRRIFDNLQKAFGYIIAIHVPIAGLSLIPVLAGNFPLILWPVHIVFLELIIDPSCSIIFEAEKEEPTVMSRPPQKINDKFFSFKKALISGLQGLAILAVTLAIYAWGLHLEYDEKEIRAMTFTTLIIANIALIITNRSWTDNIFKILATPNPAMLWVSSGAIFFLGMIFNIPFFLSLFQFEKIHLPEFILCLIMGLSTIIWFEIYKRFNRKRKFHCKPVAFNP